MIEVLECQAFLCAEAQPLHQALAGCGIEGVDLEIGPNPLLLV